MPRLTTRYSHGMPVLTLSVACGQNAVPIGGIVDSGADGTLLPKALAPLIGIPDTELIATPNSNGAGGTSFPTWTAPRPIAGQVLAFLPTPQMWGPVVALSPRFAENATALFGRADFFKAFVIVFAQDAQGEVFHLDY